MIKKILVIFVFGRLCAATCPAAADELKNDAEKLQSDTAALKKKGEELQVRANKVKADGEWVAQVQAGLQERIKGIEESTQTFQQVFKNYQDFVLAVRNFNNSQGKFENFLGQVTNR